MAIISALVAECPGILHPKLSYKTRRYGGNRFKDYNAIRLISRKIPNTRICHALGEGFGTKYTASVERNHHQLSFDNDFTEEPFWLSQMKEAFRALKSLLGFLAEQPSQLKYIEWPTFQSTLFSCAPCDQADSCHLMYAHDKFDGDLRNCKSLNLKTASLTLVLVGVLIIALSSVDSALCYLLALLSRRTA
ncbi:unnamed protein product [Ilex paraguariensis]|uniref:Uncharacterized protein n=1 Tax=Ilex paraguariensis TaxID=185542 RepID=A0ABC8UJ77_9AQUA